MAGQWEFPVGKIKLNETPQDSLQRELKEELDIEVTVGRFIGQSTVTSDGKVIELEVFVCELVSNDPRPLEHSGIQWVSHDELLHFDLASADIPLARKLVENVLIGK